MENVKYFIENTSGEWYEFVFKGMHTTSNNPHFVCGCNDCKPTHNWTKDPLMARAFDSETEAFEALTSLGWIDCKITEHEFINHKNKTMNTEETKQARALDAPANHSLQDCLKELKAGRRADQQVFLDECIARLNQDKGQLYVDMIKHLNTIESDVDIARFTVSNLGKTSSVIRKLRELIEKM